MPTTTIQINNKCSQLVITTNGDPITTLNGRLSGNNISFTNFTYEDLKMRRKAQILKYNKEVATNKKKTYSDIVNRTGYYSQSQLLNFLNSRTQDCPNKTSSSSCSGVIGSKMNYYLDPKVPYYSSI